MKFATLLSHKVACKILKVLLHKEASCNQQQSWAEESRHCYTKGLLQPTMCCHTQQSWAKDSRHCYTMRPPATNHLLPHKAISGKRLKALLHKEASCNQPFVATHSSLGQKSQGTATQRGLLKPTICCYTK